MAPAWNSLRNSLSDIASSTTAAVDGMINEDVIRLAVTGLSRAGKTVFITSLIHNLLALGSRINTLPAVARRLGGESEWRLLGVSVLPAGAADVPHFDFGGNLARLAADQPTWPQRTEDVARISLALIIARKSAVGQKIGPRRIRLDILDYPGEWLLDLPLLDQTFAEWSAQMFPLLRQPPRQEAFTAFFDVMAGFRPGDRIDEGQVRQAHELYRAGLETCRAIHGLRYLQPGRFLCPGPLGDVPFMWFFPLETSSGGRRLGGTLEALLTERFEAYKRAMRTSFFDSWFSAFDRQVMLVDVLGGLYAGQAAFEDTTRAIRDIAGALRYGSQPGAMRHVAAAVLRGANPLLPAVLGRRGSSAAQHLTSRRIGRVVFVATKADHVPALKRDNLRHLLRALCNPTEAYQKDQGASVEYRVAASLLSTEDSSAKLDGQTVQVVRGIKLGEDKVRPFYVGEVPSTLPSADFWAEPFFELPQFRPPLLNPRGEKGLPHLGLDQILDDLIGDLL